MKLICIHILTPGFNILNLQTLFFCLVSWGGVRLSPLSTSATNWPIVPAPDMIDHECGAVSRMRIAGETEILRENLPNATSSTTNPTCPALGSNLDRSS
jgi:hypothetical protein